MMGLYSIRMRGAEGGPHEEGGRHISGAERIVEESDLESVAASLIHRALQHSKGKSDFINIRIDAVHDEDIAYVDCIAIDEHQTESVKESHELAKELLQSVVTNKAVEQAFTELGQLPGNMRGAILLDANTGVRLDQDNMRGVRVSHMDACGTEIIPMNVHMREALVLATKVQSCPGIVGELCWSDDPDYTVGYVACNGVYHRIPNMKDMGNPIGGRVFLVDINRPIHEIVDYLENITVLVRW